MMPATNESVGRQRPGEQPMSNGGRDWQRKALYQQATLERQVVLGHLLPQYQAAADWQDMVRAQRFVECESVRGTPSGRPHAYWLLRDLLRRWRLLALSTPAVSRSSAKPRPQLRTVD